MQNLSLAEKRRAQRNQRRGSEGVDDVNELPRRKHDRRHGVLIITAGFDALSPDMNATVMLRVAPASDFNLNNDERGEHDFGSSPLVSREFSLKINAYEANMRQGLEEPHGPAKTARVLTIMLVEEH